MVLFSDLKLRTISSLILLFISLSALIMGGIYFDLLITLISIILSFEWMRIISNNYWIIRGIISSFGLIFILTNNGTDSILLISAVITTILISSFSRLFSVSAFLSSIGFIYILSAMSVLKWLMGFEKGLIGIIIIFLTVIISEISGYIFGNIIGGPKLFKKISPNKTLSGLLGSFFLGILSYYLFSLFYSSNSNILIFSIGFCIVLVSILGDLIISSLKRRSNMKDSGFILPGHGGLFDRLDGLLAVLIFFPFISAVFGHIGNPISIIFG